MNMHQRMLDVMLDFEAQIDTLFKQLIHSRWDISRRQLWEPPVDVIEKEDEVEIIVDLPGVDIETFDISLEKNNVIIAGNRPEHTTERSRKFLSERNNGPCGRVIRLDPYEAYGEVITNYRNGVLHVTVKRQATHRAPDEH
ncbi:MAG: Hsp20 family protein [Chitinivibrionales bacterium]|nr:Hsp20 family protein [Chitinivibrionales bacterium]